MQLKSALPEVFERLVTTEEAAANLMRDYLKRNRVPAEVIDLFDSLRAASMYSEMEIEAINRLPESTRAHKEGAEIEVKGIIDQLTEGMIYIAREGMG